LNIGDPLGNATIYAAPPESNPAADSPLFGYRYFSDEKTSAAIPIHVAMAQLVAEEGGASSTEQMMAADLDVAKTVNDAYASPFVEAEPTDANRNAKRVKIEE